MKEATKTRIEVEVGYTWMTKQKQIVGAVFFVAVLVVRSHYGHGTFRSSQDEKKSSPEIYGHRMT